MKLITLFLFSFLLFADDYIDFVHDLDGHLLFDATYSQILKDDYVIAKNKKYLLADHVRTFLLSLKDIPQARISFYSYGEHDRNVEALSRIKLNDEHTALDLAMTGEGKLRVFSKQDVIDFKKDLKMIAQDVNLNQAFLLDDQKGFAHPQQLKNHIHSFSGPLIEDIKTPNDVLSNFRLRNEYIRLRGLIDLAMEESGRLGITMTEAMYEIQFSADSVKVSRAFQFDIYERGLKRLRDIDPNIKFHLKDSKGCFGKLQSLFLNSIF